MFTRFAETDFMAIYFMASPRLFYPLQQPVTPNSLLPPAWSAPVLRRPRAHTAPAAASARAALASISISPCPVRSAESRQSLHTTFLPDRAESALCGRVPPLSSIPHRPAAAPPGAPHYQTANRADRSSRSASLHPALQIHPRPPAQSKSPAPCAGTTTASGSPPHAAQSGRSTFSNSTRRGTVSSRETLSGTHPGSYPRRRPDRLPSDKPARTPDAEIPQLARRMPLPSRP